MVPSDLDPEFARMVKVPPYGVRINRKSVVVSAIAVLMIAYAVDPRGTLALIVIGPLVGATCGAMRGRGIIGGMFGGLLAFCGFGAVMYARAYSFPEPNTVDYLGPVLSFMVLAPTGMLVGAVVGFLHAFFIDRPSPKATAPHRGA